VRNIEDRFVDRGLSDQSRRREDELIVRILLAVDPGVDGGTAIVETKGRVLSHQHRAQDVRGLVSQNAGREAECEPLPVIIGR